MTAPPFLSASVTVAPQGTLILDTPCRKCGYNLRGLSLTGRCPECATPVGISVHGKLLRFSHPRWLRNLRYGVNLILWSVALFVLLFIVLIAAGMSGIIWTVFLTAAMGLAAYALYIAGAWLLTSPDPGGIGEDEYGTARRIIRMTLVIGVAEQVLSIFDEVLSPPPEIHTLLRMLGLVASIIGLVGVWAQLQYLGKLAMRIPNERIANRAEFLKWALTVSFAVIVIFGAITALIGAALGAAMGCIGGIAGLALIVFAIMYLLMLEKLGKALKQEQSVSEQIWAAEEQQPTT